MSEMEFEQQLKKAMRRVDAPGGLAGLVLRATEAEQRAEQPVRRRGKRSGFAWPWSLDWSRAGLGGAVAAVMVLALLGVGGLHVRQEHERARMAEQEFEVSQQITEQALEHTREQLQRAGVPGLVD